MKTRRFASALFWASIALGSACGGGKKVVGGPSPGGEGDDPATPFYDGAVKASLRKAAGSAECGVPAGATLGDHFDTQKASIRAGGMLVEEKFGCRARPDNRWDCEWSLSGVPGESAQPAEPSPENPCGAENPCAGEGGGGFMIMATVGNDGSVNAKDIHCVAPG